MIFAQIVAIFLIGFGALWFGITSLMRKLMKMSKTAQSPTTTGSKLAESRWGTALINGVSCKNSLKITHFENGFELHLMPIFGRGYLWLPNDELEIGAAQQSRRLIKSIALRQMKTAAHKVTLSGHLAEFLRNVKADIPASIHEAQS